MNSTILSNIWRFVLLVIIQVLILRQMGLGVESFSYVHLFIYPLFLILLPIRIPHAALITVGFVLGLTVDAFYGTPGVHASACLWTTLFRPLVLRIMEPRGKYKVGQSPTKAQFKGGWFAVYAGVMLLIHILAFYCFDIFTFVFLGKILKYTVLSWIFSTVLIFAYVWMFNPKE